MPNLPNNLPICTLKVIFDYLKYTLTDATEP